MRAKTINMRRGAFGQPSVPFLLSRRAKGALTHHPEGAVVLPAATVRSARRMRLLRKPYGQCHSSAALLSLSTQSAICFASSSKQLFPFWKQLAACLRKSATGSFIAVTGIASPATPIFFFAKKKQKRERGRKDGENKWRSTTWKPKWSAEVRDGLRLPLPLI